MVLFILRIADDYRAHRAKPFSVCYHHTCADKVKDTVDDEEDPGEDGHGFLQIKGLDHQNRGEDQCSQGYQKIDPPVLDGGIFQFKGVLKLVNTVDENGNADEDPNETDEGIETEQEHQPHSKRKDAGDDPAHRQKSVGLDENKYHLQRTEEGKPAAQNIAQGIFHDVGGNDHHQSQYQGNKSAKQHAGF